MTNTRHFPFDDAPLPEEPFGEYQPPFETAQTPERQTKQSPTPRVWASLTFNRFGEAFSITLGCDENVTPDEAEQVWNRLLDEQHAAAIRIFTERLGGIAAKGEPAATTLTPVAPQQAAVAAPQAAVPGYGSPANLTAIANGAPIVGALPVKQLIASSAQGKTWNVFVVPTAALSSQDAKNLALGQVAAAGYDPSNFAIFDNRADQWDAIPEGGAAPRGSALKVVVKRGCPGDTIGNRAAFFCDFGPDGRVKVKATRELETLDDLVRAALKKPAGSPEQAQLAGLAGVPIGGQAGGQSF
jgi:hypothetical protein